VLVVDADLRRGRLHEIFGVDNTSGFSDLLNQQAQPMQLIKSTSVPRLKVLPTGPVSPSSPLLLHTPLLGRMLSMLKREYDFVLVDTPPTLLLSDARVIAQGVAAAIVVARCSKTSKDDLSEVLYRFASERIRIQGLIFNDWKPDTRRRRDYDYYCRRA
jgi:tyrosine-protein kinase Etk/Wzc